MRYDEERSTSKRRSGRAYNERKNRHYSADHDYESGHDSRDVANSSTRDRRRVSRFEDRELEQSYHTRGEGLSRHESSYSQRDSPELTNFDDSDEYTRESFRRHRHARARTEESDEYTPSSELSYHKRSLKYGEEYSRGRDNKSYHRKDSNCYHHSSRNESGDEESGKRTPESFLTSNDVENHHNDHHRSQRGRNRSKPRNNWDHLADLYEEVFSGRSISKSRSSSDSSSSYSSYEDDDFQLNANCMNSLFNKDGEKSGFNLIRLEKDGRSETEVQLRMTLPLPTQLMENLDGLVPTKSGLESAIETLRIKSDKIAKKCELDYNRLEDQVILDEEFPGGVLPPMYKSLFEEHSEGSSEDDQKSKQKQEHTPKEDLPKAAKTTALRRNNSIPSHIVVDDDASLVSSQGSFEMTFKEVKNDQPPHNTLDFRVRSLRGKNAGSEANAQQGRLSKAKGKSGDIRGYNDRFFGDNENPSFDEAPPAADLKSSRHRTRQEHGHTRQKDALAKFKSSSNKDWIPAKKEQLDLVDQEYPSFDAPDEGAAKPSMAVHKKPDLNSRSKKKPAHETHRDAFVGGIPSTIDYGSKYHDQEIQSICSDLTGDEGFRTQAFPVVRNVSLSDQSISGDEEPGQIVSSRHQKRSLDRNLSFEFQAETMGSQSRLDNRDQKSTKLHETSPQSLKDRHQSTLDSHGDTHLQSSRGSSANSDNTWEHDGYNRSRNRRFQAKRDEEEDELMSSWKSNRKSNRPKSTTHSDFEGEGARRRGRTILNLSERQNNSDGIAGKVNEADGRDEILEKGDELMGKSSKVIVKPTAAFSVFTGSTDSPSSERKASIEDTSISRHRAAEDPLFRTGFKSNLSTTNVPADAPIDELMKQDEFSRLRKTTLDEGDKDETIDRIASRIALSRKLRKGIMDPNGNPDDEDSFSRNHISERTQSSRTTDELMASKAGNMALPARADHSFDGDIPMDAAKCPKKPEKLNHSDPLLTARDIESKIGLTKTHDHKSLSEAGEEEECSSLDGGTKNSQDKDDFETRLKNAAAARLDALELDLKSAPSDDAGGSATRDASVFESAGHTVPSGIENTAEQDHAAEILERVNQSFSKIDQSLEARSVANEVAKPLAETIPSDIPIDGNDTSQSAEKMVENFARYWKKLTEWDEKESATVSTANVDNQIGEAEKDMETHSSFDEEATGIVTRHTAASKSRLNLLSEIDVRSQAVEINYVGDLRNDLMSLHSVPVLQPPLVIAPTSTTIETPITTANTSYTMDTPVAAPSVSTFGTRDQKTWSGTSKGVKKSFYAAHEEDGEEYVFNERNARLAALRPVALSKTESPNSFFLVNVFLGWTRACITLYIFLMAWLKHVFLLRFLPGWRQAASNHGPNFRKLEVSGDIQPTNVQFIQGSRSSHSRRLNDEDEDCTVVESIIPEVHNPLKHNKAAWKVSASGTDWTNQTSAEKYSMIKQSFSRSDARSVASMQGWSARHESTNFTFQEE